MRTVFFFSAIAATALLVQAVACSSDTTTNAATDAGSSDALEKKEAAAVPDGGPGADANQPDEPASIEIRCTSAEYLAHDFSGVDAGFTDSVGDIVTTITGPTEAAPSQYAPNCVQIKAGQRLAFATNMKLHPLQTENKPDGGVSTTTGGSGLALVYPKPGEFGFQCRTHPSTMFGAVKVVP